MADFNLKPVIPATVGLIGFISCWKVKADLCSPAAFYNLLQLLETICSFWTKLKHFQAHSNTMQHFCSPLQSLAGFYWHVTTLLNPFSLLQSFFLVHFEAIYKRFCLWNFTTHYTRGAASTKSQCMPGTKIHLKFTPQNWKICFLLHFRCTVLKCSVH